MVAVVVLVEPGFVASPIVVVVVAPDPASVVVVGDSSDDDGGLAVPPSALGEASGGAVFAVPVSAGEVVDVASCSADVPVQADAMRATAKTTSTACSHLPRRVAALSFTVHLADCVGFLGGYPSLPESE